MKTDALKKACACAACALLAGCFTWHEAEMPASSLTAAPKGRDVKVNVTGFLATVVQVVSVWGHETAYVDGGWYGWGPHHHGPWGGAHCAVATTETLVPQASTTDAFLKRAQSHLEESGYLVRATPSDYTLDVTFAGPFKSDAEAAVETAWMFCSVLSAEYATETWTAKMKIYDAKTSRLLFSRDLSQKYDVAMWSPLFFIGLSGQTKTTHAHIESWCLTALTDRALAEATRFLAQPPAPANP